MPKKVWRKFSNEALLALLGEGLTGADAARRLGVARQSVYGRIAKLRIGHNPQRPTEGRMNRSVDVKKGIKIDAFLAAQPIGEPFKWSSIRLAGQTTSAEAYVRRYLKLGTLGKGTRPDCYGSGIERFLVKRFDWMPTYPNMRVRDVEDMDIAVPETTVKMTMKMKDKFSPPMQGSFELEGERATEHKVEITQTLSEPQPDEGDSAEHGVSEEGVALAFFRMVQRRLKEESVDPEAHKRLREAFANQKQIIGGLQKEHDRDHAIITSQEGKLGEMFAEVERYKARILELEADVERHMAAREAANVQVSKEKKKSKTFIKRLLGDHPELKDELKKT